MHDDISLRDHLLIAMPSLEDPNFSRTVTYLCEHNEEGAMGLVINRPLDITLGEVLEHMEITAAPGIDISKKVYGGGPVQLEHGFVLHSPVGQWQSSLPITDKFALSTSKDILEAIARGEGPEKHLIALGYAGWGPGQLEREMAQNSWLSGPANSRILFDLPTEKRWEAAAALLGIDLHLLSSEVGHA